METVFTQNKNMTISNQVRLANPNQLRMTVYASLFAALIAAGAFIAIPIGPVPIVLQNDGAHRRRLFARVLEGLN